MYTNLAVLAWLVWQGDKPAFTLRIVGGTRAHAWCHPRPHTTPAGPLAHTHARTGFVGQFVVLCLVPSGYFLGLDESSNVVLVLGGTALAAIATAFLDSRVIALSAHYPQRVQEFFQVGVGLSTLIGSLYRDATKLTIKSTVQSSLIYFYSGALTIVLCCLSYFWLLGLRMSRHCLAHSSDVEKLRGSSSAHEGTPLLAMTEKGMVGDGDSIGMASQEGGEGARADKKVVLRKVLRMELQVSWGL